MKYDIFISYRKLVSGQLPELLWEILENNGYRSRVSFDKDNLTGKFNIELFNRIDHCKDFVLLILPDTFCNCDPNDIVVAEFYRNLSALSIEQFEEEVRKLENLSQKELAEKINWKRRIEDVHIDYLRLEINRAIKANRHIIPVTLQDSEKYKFNKLNLPNDLKPIKEYQAVFYSDAVQARFNTILPDLKKQLTSLPYNKIWFRCIMLLFLLIVGYFMHSLCTSYFVMKEEFIQCKTYQDYKKFIDKNPKTKFCDQAQDSINLMLELRNEGKAYVNNAGAGYVRDSNKQENMITNIGWDPKITLLQLRTIKDLLNHMMFVRAENITYIMGCVDNTSYDAPKHKVTLTKSFYICQYEVTREWYHAIMNDSVVTTDKRYPISNVSWDEAIEFSEKLKSLTRLSFNLPSEAQWEWAATCGEDYNFAGGNDARDFAWYQSNANSLLHDVGRKNPNYNQLYDMSGNVAEWCLDNMKRYSDEEQTDPIISDSTNRRVVRGGSYLTNERDLSVRHRAMHTQSESASTIGFRVLLVK